MAEGGSFKSDTTLVKYNNPVLVVKHPEKKRPRTAAESKSSESIPPQLLPGSAPPCQLAATSAESTSEEILQSILPPKCWEEDGNLWTQTVSSTPASRQEVINLQELLDTKLEQSQARETGICPVRRELYMQCFGEEIENSFDYFR